MQTPPLSKIWHCELSVEEYAELGKQIEVPAQDCPGCERRLTFWGWYERGMRRPEDSAERLRIWVRRSYCRVCDRWHGQERTIEQLHRAAEDGEGPLIIPGGPL